MRSYILSYLIIITRTALTVESRNARKLQNIGNSNPFVVINCALGGYNCYVVI